MLSKLTPNIGLLSKFTQTFSTISRSMELEKSKQISSLMKPKSFVSRHIGPTDKDIEVMLKEINSPSLKDLIKEAVPHNILHSKKVNESQEKVLGQPVSEGTALEYIKSIAEKNTIMKNYIGMGFNPTILPSAILLNVFMNPNWLTSYTPYQAEISQGRLEALLNYQTVITELTGLEMANASLLDEGSACTEAMYMACNIADFKKKKFFIDKDLFPYIKKCLRTKAHFLNIEIVEGDYQSHKFDESYFGGIVQNPDDLGRVKDYSQFTKDIKKIKAISIVTADIASLLLVKSPKEMGFDIACGNTQRFGLPLLNGGPHAGFLACDMTHRRKMPGRLVGLSKDVEGQRACRLALQTREQHIRRDKATSNICTAQALVANLCGFYALFHGKQGLIDISKRINKYTNYLLQKLKSIDFKTISEEGRIFDTIVLKFNSKEETKNVIRKFLENKINLREIDDLTLSLALNETTTLGDLEEIIQLFQEVKGFTSKYDISKEYKEINSVPSLTQELQRDTTGILNQEMFNKFSSEHQIIRYIKELEAKDISLTNSMISLGSCTMKLNASTELLPIYWDKFSSIHPFASLDQKKGYMQLIAETESMLKSVTQFDGVSIQPNSGATGEYTGLFTIRRYFESKGEGHRNICLIPNSSHGTNFASASSCGLKVIVIDTDKEGNIDEVDLKKKILQYKDVLCCMMITYPSTHGVYEENIKSICEMVHQYGGQLYMDGANMNAQVCVTSPGFIGADVCHLNLHKTFALPHGGGGPGIGPICVKKHLIPFLPGKSSEWQITSAPVGSVGMIPIAHMYFKMMGKDLKKATEVAVLNSNYLMKKLEPWYPIVFKGKRGRCAHEFIIDIDKIKKTSGISEEDIAKRLMDYGFHGPTMSFPVHGTLMIEPTESEDKKELDIFIESMIKIRKEIKDIETGNTDKNDNMLKNAPHTQQECLKENWKHPYSREAAAFPLGFARRKVWPSTRRINNLWGDINLVSKCMI